VSRSVLSGATSADGLAVFADEGQKKFFSAWLHAPAFFIEDHFITAETLANTGFSILIYAKLKFGHYFSVSILSIQTRAKLRTATRAEVSFAPSRRRRRTPARDNLPRHCGRVSRFFPRA